ncbi:MAG TPA: GFA family protein [Verrucomicrobiae bacterium]|nr:GFA family protein [Verrucomicrobiae bacterium]
MNYPVEGGCSCRAVRYRMTSAPMTVHCCHCTWCQRETGSAFALNAVIEAERVEVMQGEAVCVVTPSASGKGQQVYRCPNCQVALWSHYGGGGATVRFVRVGTLDDPATFPPDIHVFTSTKQPWVQIPPSQKAFAEFYDARKEWPAEAQARWKATRR